MKIAGVDEAGRGALAGPVIACCVLFKPSFLYHNDLNDSKKLSEESREIIFNKIKPHIFLSIGCVSPSKIDDINILNATLLAMKKAILKCKQSVDHIIIDGNKKPSLNLSIETRIKADATIPEVQAASICAKVIRDKIMQKKHKLHKFYEFNINKGYGTKKHYDFIHKHGPSSIHRLSYNLNKQLTLW